MGVAVGGAGVAATGGFLFVNPTDPGVTPTIVTCFIGVLVVFVGVVGGGMVFALGCLAAGRITENLITHSKNNKITHKPVVPDSFLRCFGGVDILVAPFRRGEAVSKKSLQVE